LDAIAAIERYAGRNREQFLRDELVQVWYLRHLQIIGEAVRGLPEDVRALASGVPWQKIVGMRNVLVHGYFEIDADVVWEAATRDVPALKPGLEQLLKRLEETPC